MSLKELGKVTEDGVQFKSHLDGSSHFLSPERAIEIQVALGADIIMTLDECVEYPASHEALKRAVKLTTRWAGRCKRTVEESEVRSQESEEKDPGSGLGFGFGRLARVSGQPPVPSPNPDPLTPNPALFGIVQGVPTWGCAAKAPRKSWK